MKTDEQIVEELKAASNGLLMMSESDYPFKVVRWGEELPEQLRDAGGASQAKIEMREADDFFRAATTEREGMRAEDHATVDRYRKLVRVLKESLVDLKVYKVGTLKMDVYVIGRSSDGTWMGLTTQVVET